MSTAAGIAKLLMTNLYSNQNATKCGPDLAYSSYHPEVRLALPQHSSELNDIPYIIPQICLHPKISVLFDFTYKFTADFTSVAGVSTQRPVSEATLQRVGAELTRFFDYYFEYVLSYGKRKDKSKTSWQFGVEGRSSIRRLVDWDSSPSEADVNLFINEVLNFFLMGVSVEKNINEVGGCTINFTDNYNFRGDQKVRLLFNQTFGILSQLFVPMVPVMVWASGRLYPDWMFPIFDGYITSPESAVTGGFSELSINCNDILELARISTEMVNPSLVQVSELVHQNNINIFTQPLYGQDHLEIFKALFMGGNLVYDQESQRLREQVATTVSDTAELNFAALGSFEPFDGTNTPYEAESELARGAILRKDWNIKTVIDTHLSHKRKRGLVLWGQSITPYRIFSTASPQTFTGEFSSRLEILQNIAQLVYYNFYVDGYGDVHYHPMRLSNEFLKYELVATLNNNNYKIPYCFPGSQVIGAGETTNSNSRINVGELVTFLRVQGFDPFATPEYNQMLMFGSWADTEYMSRFGYRRKSISNELFNYNVDLATINGKTFTLLDFCAQTMLQYMNGELYTTSRTIVFRPELKLAAPVLFPEDDEVFYCQSISHNIRINGEATTTVNANLGRKTREAPSDLMSFIVLNELVYKSNNQPPPIAAGATPEDVQKYYQQYYGINNIPFEQWIKDLSKQRSTYIKYEDAVSMDKASHSNIEEENF